MFTFDGANKRIRINNSAVSNGVVTFTPQQLWTEYIDWYLTGDNSKYGEAFRTIGGDIVNSQTGEAVGIYLFMRNDLGWRGVPPTVDGVAVVINGAFYAEDSTLPVMENIVGQETDLVINRSVINTAIVSSAPGVSFTLAQIADAVWSRDKRELTNVIESGPTKEEIADEVASRTLDANIVSVTDTAVTSIVDFNTGEGSSPAAIWEYSTRALTEPAGLSVEEHDHLLALSNYDDTNVVESLDRLLDYNEGTWKVVSNQMIYYDRLGDEFLRFDLKDASGAPASRASTQRVKV